MNPVLECVADQMNHDQQMPGQWSGLALRNHIVKALMENRIQWPAQHNSTISKGSVTSVVVLEGARIDRM